MFESAWNDTRVLARPFIELCLIQFFLQTINPTSRWWKRLTLLLNSDFPDLKHLGIDLSAIGIIDGWEEWDWVTITRNKKPLSSITTSG